MATIGDLAQVDSGPAFSSKHFGFEGSGVRLLRGDNIAPGRLRWQGARTWPYELILGYEHLLVNEGDLILAMDRPLVSAGLKLARVNSGDAPALLVQRVARIRATGVDPAYLYFLMQTPEFSRHILGSEVGTQIPHITLKSIKSFCVPLPPLEEQRRLVELLEDHLSRLDAASTLASGAERRGPVLRLAQLRHWRDDSLLGSRMHLTPLGQIADTALGKMLDAKRATGELTPYLRNINVRWGRVNAADIQTVPLSSDELTKFALRRGDLLVCEGGEPGRCAIWDSDESMSFQKALHRVRVHDSEQVDTAFLRLMLEEFIRSGRARGLLTGTTIKHLPQEKLRAIPLPVPPVSVQRQVVSDARLAEDNESRLTESLRRVADEVTVLRRSLLASAISGQLTQRAGSESIYV